MATATFTRYSGNPDSTSEAPLVERDGQRVQLTGEEIEVHQLFGGTIYGIRFEDGYTDFAFYDELSQRSE